MHFDWSERIRVAEAELFRATEAIRPFLSAEELAEVDPRPTLRRPGASEGEIATTQARLGQRLPPSFVSFLRVTNGLRSDPHFFQTAIHPLGRLRWFDMPGFTDDGSRDEPSEDELGYGPLASGTYRNSDLPYCLALTEYDGNVILLNPRLRNGREWEAMWLGKGDATRWRSFEEMMDRLLPRPGSCDSWIRNRQRISAPKPAPRSGLVPGGGHRLRTRLANVAGRVGVGDWASRLSAWRVVETELAKEKLASGLSVSSAERALLEEPVAMGASKKALSLAEKRLGVSLPPSYRAFLSISNGFAVGDVGFGRLLRTDEIDFVGVLDPPIARSWRGARRRELTPKEHLEYYECPEPERFRTKYLDECVVLSDPSRRELILMNTGVSFGTEYEFWWLSPGMHGAVRRKSFWDLIEFLSPRPEDAIEAFRTAENLDKYN
ncbi:MAG: SMI1/KNR4 family protein [Deltaproteobacteria bacterium]|nr:SMI1/KNR4 family protein [Deltaproteobacteria bacterium]